MPDTIKYVVNLIILLSLLAVGTECQPNRNGFTPNTRYSYAGRYTVNIDTFSTSNYYSYVISRPNSGGYCLASIGALSIQTNTTMDVFVSTDCYSISVTAANSTIISKLGVSYFVYYDQNLNGNPFQYYNSAINVNISKDPSTFKTTYFNYSFYYYYYYNPYTV